MMGTKGYLIHNAKIFTEKSAFRGSLRIEGELIAEIFKGEIPDYVLKNNVVIDASELWLMPGIIDTHVHFRQPGMTQKADIVSETKAAAAGGVTSFFDMPNTIPQTTNRAAWEEKCRLASEQSLINYACYIGLNADEKETVLHADTSKIPGVKLFLGSSTGNMLTNDKPLLEWLFAESPLLIMTHCEDNAIIQRNLTALQDQFFAHSFEGYGGGSEADIPIRNHPLIRSAEACYKSTAETIELALRHKTRLHVAHITTAIETALFDNTKSLAEKQITAEGCPHYFWFDDSDYDRLGTRIKCNPAIKSASDRKALIQALITNRLDTVASDHAPHLLQEKEGGCLKAASGMPLIQYALPAMLQLSKNGVFTVEKVVEKMCHAPATLFKINKRGYIRKGYFADLILVNPNAPYVVTSDAVMSKCGWSPFEGETFNARITHTFVNGNLVYENGKINTDSKGSALQFNA